MYRALFPPAPAVNPGFNRLGFKMLRSRLQRLGSALQNRRTDDGWRSTGSFGLNDFPHLALLAH